MKNLIFIPTFCLLIINMMAQPTYIYNFDQCSLVENNSNLPDLTVLQGNINCACGPNTEALDLDGSQLLQMDQPGNLLRQNFSLSFYMRPNGGTRTQSILTNGKSCTDRDSLLDIRFLPTRDLISINISDFGALRGLVEARIDINTCWQHVMLVKDGRILTLYINGVLGDRFEGDIPIHVRSTIPFILGGSTCTVAQNVDHFSGRLDELKWYDRALDPLEVVASITPIDQIITTDTVIFLGDSFIPRVSNTCANSIRWSPTNGLSSSSIIDPMIGPTMTTSYEIQFQNGNCIAYDSLKVTVVDPNDVDCNQLLLPTAFTPNSDRVNDTYFISNSYIIENLSFFQILDRGGNSLFETTDPNQRWDGVYQGTLMPSGSYIYKVVYTCSGEEYSKIGSFNIIR